MASKDEISGRWKEIQEAFAAASSLTVKQRAIATWAFEQLDKDGNGIITRQEVEEAGGCERTVAKTFVAIMDENNDGHISYEEWIQYYTANPGNLETFWGAKWRKAHPVPLWQRLVVVGAVIAIIILRPKSVRPH